MHFGAAHWASACNVTMWASVRLVVVATALGLSVLRGAMACSADNVAGCRADLKTTRCKTSLLDISFNLDNSGSMTWAMDRNYQVQRCPTEIVDAKACRRGDIMRITLRKLLKEIFKLLQQECIEYMLGTDAGSAVRNCVDSGFTLPRFHVTWFSSENVVTTDESQMFQGPSNLFYEQTVNEGIWNKDFKDYFFESNGDMKDHCFQVTNFGDHTKVKFVDSCIDDFFSNYFMKDEGVNRVYPTGAGATHPRFGLAKLKEILTDAYSKYDDRAQKFAKFVIVTMTDGELTAGNQPLKDLSNEVVTALENKQKFVGVGLTGNDALMGKQIELFELEPLYEYKNQNGDQYFFKDDDTAQMVIDNIFREVREDCEDCYGLVCGPIGWGGPSDDNATIPEEKTSYEYSGLVKKAIFRNLPYPEYVKVDNDVLIIPQDTALCSWTYYEGQNRYNGLQHVDFTMDSDELKCACCDMLDADGGSAPSGCVCDLIFVKRASTTAMSEVNINGTVLNVPVLDGTMLGAWIGQQQQNASNPRFVVVSSGPD